MRQRDGPCPLCATMGCGARRQLRKILQRYAALCRARATALLKASEVMQELFSDVMVRSPQSRILFPKITLMIISRTRISSGGGS
jgi:hypothetical protein